MQTITWIPNFCYPIDYVVDHQRLCDSVMTLLDRLDISLDWINHVCSIERWFGYSINLTHIPGLQGSDRWHLWQKNHSELLEHGIKEIDFTEMLDEIKDLYLGQVLTDVSAFGVRQPFVGRCQLTWLGSHRQYPMHKDVHVAERYHVAVFTNPDCHWIFDHNGNKTKLHMPADGRVWKVEANRIAHTFVNDGAKPRMHLLINNYTFTDSR